MSPARWLLLPALLLACGTPTNEQHGKFVAEWTRQPDGTWPIARLFRVPLPADRTP